VGVLFAALGILLLPWALWLGYSLPERTTAHHWDLAWGGFDVVLSVASRDRVCTRHRQSRES
jgi:hypothetical protein